MPRLARLPGVCLASLLVSLLAAAALAEGPQLAPMRTEVQATDSFVWMFGIRLRNPMARGVYTDSLSCWVEDTGPGGNRASRWTRLPLSRALVVVPSISAGDSALVTLQSPAICESGVLHLAFHTHDADGRFYVDSANVVVKPGATSRRYRSHTTAIRGQEIETVLIPALVSRTPLKPAILLIHGENSQARQMLPIGWALANEGYTVMLVSQPGYGLSTGKPDWSGPATMRAVSLALDQLRRAPEVDSNRVAVWGVSRGATAAMLLAARRKDVRAVVAQGGIYDLTAVHRDSDLPSLREAIVAEAGKDSVAWRERSPSLQSATLKAPVLLIHGEKDTHVPFAQASAMAARLKAAGATVETRFLPDGGSLMEAQPASRTQLDFLKRMLAP